MPGFFTPHPTLSLLRRFAGALLCFVIGGCSGLDLLNMTVPSGGYTLAADMPYDAGPRQKLDVFTPKDTGERRPVVLFFYGGSWSSGERADYRFVGEALTSKGFVAVIADYRLYPEVTFPAFQADGAAALRWTRDRIAEHGGDPDKIFLMGHSAGAHLAALLTVDPTYARAAGVPDGTIKGFIGLAGPYTMVPSRVASVRAVFAGVADENTTRPVHFVTPAAPPMLLLYGLDDGTVARRNAVELAAGAAKDRVTHIEYPGIGHIGIVMALALLFRGRAPVLEDTAAFVAKHSAGP